MSEIILPLLFSVAMLAIGYISGRITHIYAGHWNTPHHWIYGALMVIISIFLFPEHYYLSLFSLFFGSGHVISDFNDFINFRIFGRDNCDKKVLFGFD